MKQQHKNSLLALAIGCGLLSLPMTWMTIRGAQIQGGFGELFNSAFGGMTIDVTGLNGHITFLVKTPIWFIVLLAIAASVLQLVKESKMFAIPRAGAWGVACLAVVWVGIAIVMALSSGKASLGIGALLGLTSAAIPMAMLLVPTPTPEAHDADEH